MSPRLADRSVCRWPHCARLARDASGLSAPRRGRLAAQPASVPPSKAVSIDSCVDALQAALGLEGVTVQCEWCGSWNFAAERVGPVVTDA